jgi:aspartyl-tRNA(Asn)/glutamyl-tRNA(Gln) amidotransferase subunit B
MTFEFEAVIGLEIHAELETRSKMFCACPVVDPTQSEPNIAVCPVCSGMPGVLPVINQQAVEYGLRVAMALDCEIAPVSIFARKNYFYPDLPKGYQISQYEEPLARNGRITILTSQGAKTIRIRRVHLEEDTGKLTHVNGEPVLAEDGSASESGGYSLVDLNRAGVPLLEIVTEPDMHTAEEVRTYAMALRSLLRYLGVNSGDMQKGVMRIEPNVSIRPVGSQELGIRTEIKNLNSLRALERGVAFEIRRQAEVLRSGKPVTQETRGWNEALGETFAQRSKEDADDYRYFPEPDLPPLVVDANWIQQVREALPELPNARFHRFQAQYGLSSYDAGVLTEEITVADYFEQAVKAAPHIPPKNIANWLTGDLFGLFNQAGTPFDPAQPAPESLALLVSMVLSGSINQATAKTVLSEMFETGKDPQVIVQERGLRQVSDAGLIAGWVRQVLADYPEQVKGYLAGKETLSRWLFGQVMRLGKGQANPQVVQQELERQLTEMKNSANL